MVSAATDMGNYHENSRQTHTVIPAKSLPSCPDTGAGIHREGPVKTAFDRWLVPDSIGFLGFQAPTIARNLT